MKRSGMTPAAPMAKLHAQGIAVRLGPDGSIMLNAIERPSPKRWLCLGYIGTASGHCGRGRGRPAT